MELKEKVGLEMNLKKKRACKENMRVPRKCSDVSDGARFAQPVTI